MSIVGDFDEDTAVATATNDGTSSDVITENETESMNFQSQGDLYYHSQMGENLVLFLVSGDFKYNS